MFNYLIHFNFILYMIWDKSPALFIYLFGYLVILAFVEETIPSSDWSYTFVENHLTIDVWIYFWSLSFIFLVFMSTHMAVPYTILITFVVSRKTGNWQSSNFFFFKIVFGYFGSTAVP